MPENAGDDGCMMDELGKSGPEHDVTGEVAVRPSADPLRRGVQIVLAIYLLPVLPVVLLVGGVAIVFGGIARVMNRLKSESA